MLDFIKDRKSRFTNDLKRVARLLVSASFLFSSHAAAKSPSFSITGGASALEEGNDRLRPAVSWQMRMGQKLGLEIGGTYFGKKVVTVTERGQLWKLGLFGIPKDLGWAYSSTGLSYYHQKISLDSLTPSVSNQKQSIQKLGLYVGVGVLWMKLGKGVGYLQWDGYFFDAGQGSLHLAFGKKQVISIMWGISL